MGTRILARLPWACMLNPLPFVRQSFRDFGAAAINGPLRALRHADFQRFLAGQGISLVGTWMQSIAEAWLVFSLTHSAFAVGVTATLATLPIFCLTLYGGVVADRVDKRRFIMLLQTVMLLEATTLATLTLTHHITVHLIWGLAVIFGLATAFEVPARQAFIVELVPAEDLVSAAAINSTTYNLARVVGPAIAGILVAAAGPGAAFAVNALSYVAVLIGLSRIRKVHEPKVITEHQSIFTGLRFIGSRPVLNALAWQMVLLTVFAGSFIPILAVYASAVLGVGATGYGLLTSAVGVGAAIGAIGIGGMGSRFTRARVVVVASAALGDCGDPAGAGARPHVGAGDTCVRRSGDGEPGHRDRHQLATRGAPRAPWTRHGGLFVCRAWHGAAGRLPGRLCGRASRGVARASPSAARSAWSVRRCCAGVSGMAWRNNADHHLA